MVGRILPVLIMALTVVCSERDLWSDSTTQRFVQPIITSDSDLHETRQKPQASDQIDDAITRISDEKSKELKEIQKSEEERESELYVSDLQESDLQESEAQEENKSSRQSACKGYQCPPGFRCKAMFSCAPKNEYCRRFGVWRGSCVERKKKKGSEKDEDEIEQEEEDWDTEEGGEDNINININEEEDGPSTTDDSNGDTLTDDEKKKEISMSKKREKELCKDAVCGPGLKCAVKFSCAPVTSDFCKKRGKWTADCVVDEDDPQRCTYAADPGNCRALMPSWYYNSAQKSCQKFDYGGCDGNGNRFQTQEECQEACQGK